MSNKLFKLIKKNNPNHVSDFYKKNNVSDIKSYVSAKGHFFRSMRVIGTNPLVAMSPDRLEAYPQDDRKEANQALPRHHKAVRKSLRGSPSVGFMLT